VSSGNWPASRRTSKLDDEQYYFIIYRTVAVMDLASAFVTFVFSPSGRLARPRRDLDMLSRGSLQSRGLEEHDWLEAILAVARPAPEFQRDLKHL
jgi:hypothetical protein